MFSSMVIFKIFYRPIKVAPWRILLINLLLSLKDSQKWNPNLFSLNSFSKMPLYQTFDTRLKLLAHVRYIPCFYKISLERFRIADHGSIFSLPFGDFSAEIAFIVSIEPFVPEVYYSWSHVSDCVQVSIFY